MPARRESSGRSSPMVPSRGTHLLPDPVRGARPEHRAGRDPRQSAGPGSVFAAADDRSDNGVIGSKDMSFLIRTNMFRPAIALPRAPCIAVRLSRVGA